MTADEHATFCEALDKLHREKHTGPVVVHFAQGKPRQVDIPAKPHRIQLTSGKKSAQT